MDGSIFLRKGRRNYDHISDDNGSEVSKLLKIIGDLERISDHSVNVLESAEELKEKKIIFSPGAKKELEVLCSALDQILNLTVDALRRDDFGAAAAPLPCPPPDPPISSPGACSPHKSKTPPKPCWHPQQGLFF